MMRLKARVDEGSGGRQARIVGDDLRGYLLVGFPNADEIWFVKLEEAFEGAASLGVAAGAWENIESVADVLTA